MTTKISADNLSSGLLATITAGGGPKITTIEVTDNSYTVLDDTAVDIAGGYIKLTGTGFASGCQVLINNTPATSTTFVSATEVRAQVPAAAAGTYVVYLANTDGGVAIAVNGITYSATPSWATSSTLPGGVVNQAISIQLDAASATNYALQAGSSLPTGLTLSGGGLLSGTITGISTETTYSFTVVATDAENQDSPRTFSITIIVGDEYFKNTVLLLTGDGTNGAQNNTFVDSSSNNFAITRNGNATQGSFSPFSPTGWSAYFDGTGDYLSLAANSALDVGSGDFTIDSFAYPLTKTNGVDSLFGYGAWSMMLYHDNTNWTLEMSNNGSSNQIVISFSVSLNQWQHIAIVKSGTTVTVYKNGTSVGTGTISGSVNTSAKNLEIGRNGVTSNTQSFTGHISNFRLVKGTALYTSNFTPATGPLTAVSGTSLLTLQSNRFVDNSTNAFAITPAGDAKITAFSPFAPTTVYDSATHGGSLYLDGVDDFLSKTYDANFVLNTDFTIEYWTYMLSGDGGGYGSVSFYQMGEHNFRIDGSSSGTSIGLMVNQNQSIFSVSGLSLLNQWSHVAIVRSGTTYKLFVNGVQKYSEASGISQSQTGGNLAIGMNTASVGSVFDYKGYMAGFRHIRGTALYTSNFTPPTTLPTDVSGTLLLLNFVNAGVIDATAKNVVETVGNAQINTSVKKYGTGSLSFDGTGDYLQTSSVPLLNLGLGSFTWECWLYPNAVSGIKGIYATTGGSGSVPKFVVHLDGSTIKIHYNGLTGGSNIYTSSTGSISASQWTHVAFVRNGSNWTWYINGTAAGTGTNSTDLTFTTQPTYIGYGGEDYFAAFNGYIDDLRVTRGVARYTANFTPPTLAVPVQ